MRVDQLFVDPGAAALRQLRGVQLTRGEHHLAQLPVNDVPIDIDVRKVVVGADLLELPQRVLEHAPVPEPDVLQRGLIVLRISRLDRRLGRERALGETIQPVRLPRELDVVRDVRLLADKLVGLHDEALDISADGTCPDVEHERGECCSDEPADPSGNERRHHDCDSAGGQCERHEQPAGQRDVRLRVGHTGKDRVILEQVLESPEVHLHGDGGEQEAERDSEPAHRCGVLSEHGDGPARRGSRWRPGKRTGPSRT